MSRQYLLAASITLAVLALSSIIVFVFSQPKPIALPTIDSREELDGSQNEQQNDPFDVAEHEDVIDGHLLDEETFWIQVKTQKLVQAMAVALGLAAVCGHIGYSVMARKLPGWDILLLPLILEAVFLLYLLILAIYSLNSSSIPTHWILTVHSATLSTCGLVVLVIAKVLPGTSRFSTQSQELPDTVENVLEWVTLLFLLISATVSSTIPRAPA
ncbi:hypothetical protein FRC12_022998, partial [Ceratobasidium sp. 428]